MRFTFLMMLVVLAGCGASDPNRQKIVGRWQIDGGQRLSRSVSGDDDNDAAATGPKMMIEFTSDGGLSTTTKMGKIDSKKSGQWEFIALEPESSTYRLRCTLNGQVTEHAIEFDGPDAISWVPPNMAGTNRKIRFVRSSN